MSEGTVLIEGKEYVSSERAAKLVGYTKDYVGQLSRAGKIDAKRIGRSWYISQDSITKHKLSVHYILTKPKKTQKKESDIGEIPNINIDKSSLSKKSNSEQLPSIDCVYTQKNINENVMEEEYDLLPRLKEKKRDVLLHTDIRYEKAVQPVSERNQPLESLKDNHYIKSVPIRNTRRKIITRNHDFNRRNNHVQNRNISPGFDGIKVDGIRFPNRKKRSSIDMRYPDPVRSTTKQYNKTESTFAKEFIEKPNNDSSKIFPVIGAIIVFTIFVVIYIFISA